MTTFIHPVQPSVNAYRGVDPHGVEGEPTRYIADGAQHSLEAKDPAPRRQQVQTVTWQVPVRVGVPVRILPQDPDRLRAYLYVTGATVYVSSLHNAPVSDYGFPLIQGGEPYTLYGNNQMWANTLDNSLATEVYVLVERYAYPD